jgi:hypothetical protein
VCRSGPPRSARAALRCGPSLRSGPRFACDRPVRACGRSPHCERPVRACALDASGYPSGGHFAPPATHTPLAARSGRIAGSLTGFAPRASPRCSRVAPPSAHSSRPPPVGRAPLGETPRGALWCRFTSRGAREGASERAVVTGRVVVCAKTAMVGHRSVGRSVSVFRDQQW